MPHFATIYAAITAALLRYAYGFSLAFRRFTLYLRCFIGYMLHLLLTLLLLVAMLLRY